MDLVNFDNGYSYLKLFYCVKCCVLYCQSWEKVMNYICKLDIETSDGYFRSILVEVELLPVMCNVYVTLKVNVLHVYSS